jgi:hypothetical protein
MCRGLHWEGFSEWWQIQGKPGLCPVSGCRAQGIVREFLGEGAVFFEDESSPLDWTLCLMQ